MSVNFVHNSKTLNEIMSIEHDLGIKMTKVQTDDIEEMEKVMPRCSRFLRATNSW